MTKSTAKRLSDLMISVSRELTESLDVVKSSEEQPEYDRYREVVAKLLYDMLVHVMNPIYTEHPDLKPPQLD